MKGVILVGLPPDELLAIRQKNMAKAQEALRNMTPEERSAASKKAAETRERRKNFNLLAKYMMEAEIPDTDAAREELEMHGFTQADYQSAVFFAQLKKAIYSADTEAAKYVRDTAGYKPTEAMKLGNLEDKPFETLDLSQLSDAELRAMIAKREAEISED